ncbi:hypothetical protein FGO68_gene17059 [Halteria grandinella]|uniref:Uncharacterized protein n=1 Tax=Halteria grandinella TaxID=5974 RepID=A0A8J8T641_HALGN|nr:hypothetical protein FGO68_gene17059 [Halteria grandinella]
MSKPSLFLSCITQFVELHIRRSYPYITVEYLPRQHRSLLFYLSQPKCSFLHAKEQLIFDAFDVVLECPLMVAPALHECVKVVVMHAREGLVDAFHLVSHAFDALVELCTLVNQGLS